MFICKASALNNKHTQTQGTKEEQNPKTPGTKCKNNGRSKTQNRAVQDPSATSRHAEYSQE